MEADRAGARQTIDAATGELAQLMAAAGVDRVDALAPIEAQAARLAQLSVRLPELESQIAASGQTSLAEIVEGHERGSTSTPSMQSRSAPTMSSADGGSAPGAG